MPQLNPAPWLSTLLLAWLILMLLKPLLTQPPMPQPPQLYLTAPQNPWPWTWH